MYDVSIRAQVPQGLSYQIFAAFLVSPPSQQQERIWEIFCFDSCTREKNYHPSYIRSLEQQAKPLLAQLVIWTL